MNHEDTMPTFHKEINEVGIVPISLTLFIVNRHKGTKESKIIG